MLLPWVPYWFHDVVVNGIAMRGAVPVPLRMAILRWWGVRGAGVIAAYGSIGGGFSPRIRLSLAKGVVINTHAVIDVSAPVAIGRDVWLGQGVAILTGTHQIGPATRRAGTTTPLPVVIEDGCWIGARATILPGITIGAGSVVGAGAMVTKSCAPNGL